MNWCGRSLALLVKITIGIAGHVENDTISIGGISVVAAGECNETSSVPFGLEFLPSSDPT